MLGVTGFAHRDDVLIGSHDDGYFILDLPTGRVDKYETREAWSVDVNARTGSAPTELTSPLALSAQSWRGGWSSLLFPILITANLVLVLCNLFKRTKPAPENAADGQPENQAGCPIPQTQLGVGDGRSPSQPGGMDMR